MANSTICCPNADKRALLLMSRITTLEQRITCNFNFNAQIALGSFATQWEKESWCAKHNEFRSRECKIFRCVWPTVEKRRDSHSYSPWAWGSGIFSRLRSICASIFQNNGRRRSRVCARLLRNEMRVRSSLFHASGPLLAESNCVRDDPGRRAALTLTNFRLGGAAATRAAFFTSYFYIWALRRRGLIRKNGIAREQLSGWKHKVREETCVLSHPFIKLLSVLVHE